MFQGLTLSAAVAAALITMACTGKDNGGGASAQVVAKVGAKEISVHQVDNVLKRGGVLPQEMVEEARREVLEKLVVQYLLVEEAQQRKLDHSPEVVMAIEAAKRDIVARAYVDQLASKQPTPSIEEAKRYYADHVALFADRKIFTLRELVLSNLPGLEVGLRGLVAAGRSLDDIEAWLKTRQVEYTLNMTARPAEQIPLNTLPKVYALKDGELLVIDSSQSLSIVRRINAQSAPLDEVVALPKIQQFLFNQRLSELVDREVKRIRRTSRIEYVGEFSGKAANSDVHPVQTAIVENSGKRDVGAVN